MMMSPTPPKTFTGRRRRQRTRLSVRLADLAARSLITVGGIGTILAVLMVCVFLVWVVLPLFLSARVELARDVDWSSEQPPIRLGVDEYRLLGWTVTPAGVLHVLRLDTGKLIDERPLLEADEELTSLSFAADGKHFVAGLSDGSLRLGQLQFDAQFLSPDALSKDRQPRTLADRVEHEGGLIQLTPEGQLRWQRLSVAVDEPIAGETEAAVLLVDWLGTSQGSVFVSLTADERIHLTSVSRRKDLFTGQATQESQRIELPYQAPSGAGPPNRLHLSNLGSHLLVAWNDGRLLRYDVQDLTRPRLAETVDLVPDDVQVTGMAWVAGNSTLLVGDNRGQVTAWFLTQPAGAQSADGKILTPVHVFAGNGWPVTSLGTSLRSRIAAVGYGDGTVRLIQITAESVLAERAARGASEVFAVAIAPKDDGLVALSAEGLRVWDIDKRYPEVTFGTLFRPVWYEGYNEPAHVWQSSSGSDGFEPKLGLMPLVFGTLKATFYSLMFGVPLALLAAIYSSEFLHPSVKSRVKPTIELMASLPSVVLGFFAALVFAPFVEQIVSMLVAWLVTGPLSLLLGAYCWQMVPQAWALRLARWRFALICWTLPVGVVAAWWLGPWCEQWLFGGDVHLWLDGQVGRGVGGWLLLLMPGTALVLALVMGRVVNPRLRRWSGHWSRASNAAVDVVKFALGCLLVVAMSLAMALGLEALGLDPRGGFIDTYMQRNAMIVGFVMGFAIIPIIYTIAEDALSTVPNHLRSASLGAGATTWQTATRIVVPTAMSGLFSAVMVGLGRAVGETMIVLMAAGNTPLMDWNIFNGFRTLSANIAVELPEAVRNSSHFRTLFLAALTLFALTFVVNTAAEVVRQRFRRRAYQL